MKKAILLALVLVIGIALNAHALPLWDDSTSEDSTWDHTTYDRSDTNETYYDDDYGYTGTDYTGFYIGTIEGNTNGGNINLLDQAIDHYLGFEPTNIKTSKADDIDDLKDKSSYTEIPLTVTWDDSLSSGTWSLSDDDHDYEMNFYAIKGANEFALYYVKPSQSEGSWTTRHLQNGGGNIPEISHFSAAYTNPGIESVPEPATMLLFGTGLIGLAWVGRRHLQRRNDA